MTPDAGKARRVYGNGIFLFNMPRAFLIFGTKTTHLYTFMSNADKHGRRQLEKSFKMDGLKSNLESTLRIEMPGIRLLQIDVVHSHQ